MPHVVFKRVAGLAANTYLLGHYAWPKDMRIVSASATFDAPGDRTVVSLFIDGVDSGYTITLLPGATTASMSLPFGVPISSGSQVRLQVTTAPTLIDDFATNVCVVAYVVDDDYSIEAESVKSMWVNWRNGYENFKLYNYTPSTHTFSEASTGISTGRATVSDTAATIQSVAGYSVLDAGAIYHCNFADLQSVIPSEPSLEFIIGATKVGVVTQDEFFVPQIVESIDLVTSDNFCFYSPSGTLTATLGAGGLRALAITEFAP